MKYFLLILLILYSAVPAQAAKPGEQAIAWATLQRDNAMGAVVSAQSRVDAAETDLRISRNVEADIRMSKDTEAMAIANEALRTSEQGVAEAKALLKRAKDWLAREEKKLAALKESVAEYGSDKSFVVPIIGEVRRSMYGGNTHVDPLLPLRVGERIDVGANSSARVFVAGGDAEVALSQNSSFTVTRDNVNESFEAVLSRGFGRIRAKLKHYAEKKFEVRTPNGTASIRGTDFSLWSSEDKMRIEVFEGIVWTHLPNSDTGVEIHSGEGCDILKNGGIQSVKPLDNTPRENPWSDNVSDH